MIDIYISAREMEKIFKKYLTLNDRGQQYKCILICLKIQFTKEGTLC